jgi:hypothetical protein
MSRRRVSRSTAVLSSDFGPEIRLAAMRDAALATLDPARVVVKEFRTDPTLPGGGLVRGARVRDPLLYMFDRSYISKRQWDAVELFRDDTALAGGARIGTPEACGVRAQPSNRNWPSDSQLDALRRCTAILASYSDIQRRLMVWTVIQHRTLNDFGRAEKLQAKDVTAMLQDVLTTLADRYEATTKGKTR